MNTYPRLLAYAALVIALSFVAFFASRSRFPHNRYYIDAAERMINPGCAEIHCFRVLVPWTIGALPGPSLFKWKVYAVLSNAAAALAIFDLSLFLGLSARASLIAGGLTVFGFGSFGTLWQLYNSDPLMAWLTPTVLRWTLQGRILRAGVLASIGVFAKEFAIVPLAIAGIADALEHHWRRAFRAIAAGIVGFLIWVGLQVFLRTRYGYVFGDNMSPKLFEGSYLVYWLRELGPTTALLSMSNEFGPVWILFPVGWLAAPRPLRRIVIASIPIALFLAYVQQPDRSFWNFHFVIMPLAALVLEPMPDLFVWSFLAVYALAYLRTGAEISFAPPSRYAFAVGLVMAVVAGVTFVRTQRSTAASGAAS